VRNFDGTLAPYPGFIREISDRHKSAVAPKAADFAMSRKGHNWTHGPRQTEPGGLLGSKGTLADPNALTDVKLLPFGLFGQSLKKIAQFLFSSHPLGLLAGPRQNLIDAPYQFPRARDRLFALLDLLGQRGPIAPYCSDLCSCRIQ
jgi:hypothetical protein